MTTAAALCMGYGGAELALSAIMDLDLSWYAEVDDRCLPILGQRWPTVANLGDVTAIDWTAAPRVDVVTAGYPCQPFSHAGARQGEEDDRHLWPSIAEGLAVLRPPFVFLENVRAHLSLGFDRVLADLDELGYSVEWSLLAAGDVGACHGRSRLWVAATLEEAPPVDGTPVGYRDGEGWTAPQVGLWDEPVRLRPPDAGCVRAGIMYGRPKVLTSAPTEGLMPTPAAEESDPTEEFMAELEANGIDPHERLYLPGRKWHTQRTLRRVAATLLPTPSAADALGGHHTRGGDRAGEPLLGGIRYLLPDAGGDLLPTPKSQSNRASRRAMVEERQWSAPGLEQVLELAAGDLPREFVSWDEVPGKSRLIPTPTTSDAKGPSPNHAGTTAEAIDALTLLPTPAAADGERGPDYARVNREGSGGDDLVTLTAKLLPTPTTGDAAGSTSPESAKEWEHRGANLSERLQRQRTEDGISWGVYATAVDRHAELVGREPPPPVDEKRRLSPRFVEWMMTLPEGHVTDVVTHRPSALHVLGNGVVPACAAVAWAWLLRRLAAL